MHEGRELNSRQSVADFCGVTCTVYEQGMTQEQAAQPTLKPNYAKTKAHGTSIQTYFRRPLLHQGLYTPNLL